MTAVSTVLVTVVEAQLGLHWAWLAKPAVELMLGAMGFLISRHGVYRH